MFWHLSYTNHGRVGHPRRRAFSHLLAWTPLLALVSALATGAAESLAQRYAPLGDLLLTHLDSAPFPHASRAEGHQYKDQFFSAADHYADNTVAIFVPKSLRTDTAIDVVVHFHGWNNHVEAVLAHYKLIEQLAASGRNAVLVVPQGPRDAADSGGGKLEAPGGFKRFMDDVLTTLRTQSARPLTNVSLGHIILSGHSGGYQVMGAIVDRGGLADHVTEVWLFDALYARTDQFLGWFDAQHGRLLNIYTEHGGTKTETERLMARLKARGTPFLATKEAELKPEDLATNRLVFIYTELAHDDVLDRHQTFQQFLRGGH